MRAKSLVRFKAFDEPALHDKAQQKSWNQMEIQP